MTSQFDLLLRTHCELIVRVSHWPKLETRSATAMKATSRGHALAAGNRIADFIADGCTIRVSQVVTLNLSTYNTYLLPSTNQINVHSSFSLLGTGFLLGERNVLEPGFFIGQLALLWGLDLRRMTVPHLVCMQGRRRPEGAGRIVGLPMNGSYSTPTQYYRGLGTDISLPMVTERHVNDFECMSAAQEGRHSQIFFLQGVFHVPQHMLFPSSYALCCMTRRSSPNQC